MGISPFTVAKGNIHTAMVWSVIEQDRIKWRGGHMNANHEKRIAKAVVELKRWELIEVKGFEWLEVA